MMDRRTFLLNGAAMMSAPYLLGTAQASEVDVVVIGAGAAGIAAARDLRKQGHSVTVIEAADRIGGRVHTDTSVFGVPYDMGAHWLHYEEANPFAAYGRNNGFTIYKSPSEEVLRVGDRNATAEERAAYDAAVEAANGAIEAAAEAGKDVAPASVVPDAGPWNHTAHLAVGPYEMAKDLDHFSCTDWYTAEDGTDYYCREGLGALFAHSAKDVPVTLNVAARKIRWGGKGVSVETSKGTINAKGVVVTVSLGVLAAGGIQFDPPLPETTEKAFHQISMGHYTHVALKFSENFFGVGEDGFFYYKVDELSNGSPKGFAALIDAAGTGVSYCDLGGNFAKEMAKAGDAATRDFVLSELKSMFGSKVEKALLGAHVADWTSNPLTLGAYASAEPGGAASRAVLRQSVGDRIWFAGEAMSEDDWATVAGAHKSGQATAKAVSALIKA